MTRYWLKGPAEDNYREVTCAEYVTAEREHGFVNTLGRPDEPATAAFTATDGTRGTTLPEPNDQPIQQSGGGVPGFDAGHWYYNHHGEPIDVKQWAALRESERRTLQETDLCTTEEGPEAYRLVTVYLGMVFEPIEEARLFGTAIIRNGEIKQVEVHDSEPAALVRHMEHVQAIKSGQHCARCKEGRRHID